MRGRSVIFGLFQRGGHGLAAGFQVAREQRGAKRFEIAQIVGGGRRSFRAQASVAVSVVHFGAGAVAPDPADEGFGGLIDSGSA